MHAALTDPALPRAWRDVGGELTASQTVSSPALQLEMLARRSADAINWRFRQNRHALFWFRQGVDGFELSLDGQPAHRAQLAGAPSLVLVPAFAEASGVFHVAAHCDYAVVFLETQALAPGVQALLHRPIAQFRHAGIEQGLQTLCSEAQQRDNLYALFAEGWALQTLAQLARLGSDDATSSARSAGGLSATALRRVRDCIEADLSLPFRIEALAALVHLSPRHFLRAFSQSTGRTPLAYIRQQRLHRATQLLRQTRMRITDIALECGFSHAQHFSNAFKGHAGRTASDYRKEAHV